MVVVVCGGGGGGGGDGVGMMMPTYLSMINKDMKKGVQEQDSIRSDTC